MTIRLVPLALVLLVAACRDRESDAYGNFEADEIVVSSEATGQLLRFDIQEGARVAEGVAVAMITTQLALQRGELLARRATAQSRAREAAQQIAVLEAQHRLAAREYERAQRLMQSQAVTAQALDRAEREYRTLSAQIEAMRTSRATVDSEIGSVDAQIALVDDRIRKTRVVNPVAGTVIAKYAERGELVQAGRPLYRIADVDTLTLRAYVSGAQLASVRLGATVQVRVDAGPGALRTVPGRVTWVAPRAEFTPTPIQTRDQRADQVYAVRVRVANPDGALKIGMPGELLLAEPDA
jgi:HlyD family secretion protein